MMQTVMNAEIFRNKKGEKKTREQSLGRKLSCSRAVRRHFFTRAEKYQILMDSGKLKQEVSKVNFLVMQIGNERHP